MRNKERLADFDNPLVLETAGRLTAEESSVQGKLEKLFYFVRDEIKFGFPRDGDLVKASETLALGMGQCNTKGTLFLALCRAAGIPARIHFSLIKKEIQRGLFPRLAYRLMPPLISHAWLEVELEGRWRRIDSYINDEDFYQAGKRELGAKGWQTGYSVSCSKGASSSELNLEEERFVQMDAVAEDQGTYEEPADYFATESYKNRPGALKLLIYRLIVGKINRKVARLRNRGSGGSCLMKQGGDHNG